MLSENANRLLLELSTIAKRGPIKSVAIGAPAVGITLLQELGISYQSTRKPTKHGIVVTARRGTKQRDPNRVNLFASVPNWEISPVKSSAELLDRFGYLRNDERRLNCSVRTGEPNPQGLILRVNAAQGLLEEWVVSENGEQLAVAWKLDWLLKKLEISHPETIWVTAQTSEHNGIEYFHYRYASHSSAARVELFPELIKEGTITVDHLIRKKNGKVVEKGPLFKIKPRNIPLLFPEHHSFDLLSM